MLPYRRRLETNPRFTTISQPSNAAIVARLRIDMEDRGGRPEILIPFAILEPVRELLLQMFMGEKFGRDSIWETHLAEEMWFTEVGLEAILDTQTMSLSRVLDMKVGSKFLLNATAESPVILRCGDSRCLSEKWAGAAAILQFVLTAGGARKARYIAGL